MENKLNLKFYNGVKKILGGSIKLFFKPKVTGQENIPDKPYILIGNHKSILDIPTISMYIKDNIRFMAKEELFNNKLLNYIFNSLGAFPINRDLIDIKALKTCIRLLKDGNVVGIFPEGTRNKTNNIILPFKGGIDKMAKLTNCLIVPFGISGEYKLNSDLKINIGDPIDVNSIQGDKNKYLEEKVKELILK